MLVLVKKRNNKKITELYVDVKESDYPEGLDFYELVASALKWKGKEDALWYLSSHNYISLKRVKDEKARYL